MLPFTAGGLVLGVVATIAGNDALAWWAWTIPALLVAVWLAASIVADLIRHKAGVDIIAVLAIGGALLLDESLTAAVIAVMLATGNWLERYADGRARRELSALSRRAPQTVHRHERGTIVDHADRGRRGRRPDPREAGRGRPGRRHGRGRGCRARRVGPDRREPRLVTREPGRSGQLRRLVNAGGPFDLVATATAEPARTPASCGSSRRRSRRRRRSSASPTDTRCCSSRSRSGWQALAWALSGDPVRALAVLVVATPCPLLLAAPIAIVAGISRAARRGIIVKGGGALETLARARVLLFDKTGTLTAGRPQLAASRGRARRVRTTVLRLAASLEQVSPHVARGRDRPRGPRRAARRCHCPTMSSRSPGAGVSGASRATLVLAGTRPTSRLAGAAAALGAGRPSPGRGRGLDERLRVDRRRLAGALVLDDPIRPETPRAIRSLRRAGFTRMVMVTGDHRRSPRWSARRSASTPSWPSDARREGRRRARRARVGQRRPSSWSATGSTTRRPSRPPMSGWRWAPAAPRRSSEAADIVITVDRLDRLPEAVQIARRSRTIAHPERRRRHGDVARGDGASRPSGSCRPSPGALLQEAIDVVVILNALRALRGGLEQRAEDPRLDGDQQPRCGRAPRARRRRSPRSGRLADRLGD